MKSRITVELVLLCVCVMLSPFVSFPSFVKSCGSSPFSACVNNLRGIESGKEQWAMATQQRSGATVAIAEVNQYIKGNSTPVCPVGGTYTYAEVGRDPCCTIHGALSAPHLSPTEQHAQRKVTAGAALVCALGALLFVLVVEGGLWAIHKGRSEPTHAGDGMPRAR